MQSFKSFRSPLLAVCLVGLILPSSAAFAGDIKTDGKVVSTTTSGPPLEVASTERVANLNADQLDGLEGSDLYTQAQVDALIGGLYTPAEVDALLADLQSQIDELSGGTLLVMDDQDLVVGEVVDTLPSNTGSNDQDVKVLLREGIHRMVATVRKDFMTMADIYYLLPDCAGPEYIDPMVIGPDGTKIHQDFQVTKYGFAEGYVLFRAPPSEVPVQLQTASRWERTGCEPVGNNIDLVLAEEITTLGFTPPFRIVDQGVP